MKQFRPLCVLLALTFAAVPELLPFQARSGASSAKTPAAKTKTPARKPAAKSTTRKSTAKARRKTPARSTRRVKQQAPQPERIREIQHALAERGYDLEVNGVWNARSVEALKKFQEDHDIKNLSGRGKLDSLTLIALGLGPGHGPAAQPQRPPAPEGQLP